MSNISNNLVVYDSLYDSLDRGTTMILYRLYGKAVHQSRIANISEQKGVKDCGLYAIAIAVLLVKGLDPE